MSMAARALCSSLAGNMRAARAIQIKPVGSPGRHPLAIITMDVRQVVLIIIGHTIDEEDE